jgi:hypothetical protein
VVRDLHARGATMPPPAPEIRTQFLMTARDANGLLVNIGAGVDERDRVVLIVTGCEHVPLPLVLATQFLAKFRQAVMEAADQTNRPER